MTTFTLPPAPAMPETIAWLVQLPKQTFFVTDAGQAKLWAEHDERQARVTPLCAQNTLWITSLLVELLRHARSGLDENSEDTLANSLALTVSKIDMALAAIAETALPDLTNPAILQTTLRRGMPATLSRSQYLDLAESADDDRAALS